MSARRGFITLLSGAALTTWPFALRAKTCQPKMLRVGFVGIQPREFAIYAAFLERMAELSYEEEQKLYVRIYPGCEC